MTFEILMYRILRLRRLIVFSSLLPWIVALTYIADWGPFGAGIVAVIALLPVVHLVFYPNAWMETVSVSITSALVLTGGVFIDPAMSSEQIGQRMFGLTILGTILFFMMTVVVGFCTELGPRRTFVLRSSERSSLDIEPLRRAITLYPGRRDDRVDCGEPNAEGIFPITLYLQGISSSNSGDEQITVGDAQTVTEDGIVLPEMDMSGLIAKSNDAVHEVNTFTNDGQDQGLCRHEFSRRGNQTIVEYQEYASGLTWAIRFGMYLQDYLTDYLVSEIDAAEGRSPRALRSEPIHQLVVDIARKWFPPEPGPNSTNP
ncbi:MAG: hypothetical protein GKR98_06195 [Boseongicola sp.]|nr:MAG: hypothetical protein GKR98_06195 [Boseongicola sp.]